MRTNPPPGQMQSRTKFWMNLRATPAMRLATSVVLLFFIFVTTGAVLAQSALPGDSLYAFKLTTERVWLRLSDDKYDTQSGYINRRFNELIAIHGNRPEELTIKAYLNTIQSLASPTNDADFDRTLEALTKQQQILKEAGFNFPELGGLPDLLKTVVPDPSSGGADPSQNPDEKDQSTQPSESESGEGSANSNGTDPEEGDKSPGATILDAFISTIDPLIPSTNP
jgi:hypothetical protein